MSNVFTEAADLCCVSAQRNLRPHSTSGPSVVFKTCFRVCRMPRLALRRLVYNDLEISSIQATTDFTSTVKGSWECYPTFPSLQMEYWRLRSGEQRMSARTWNIVLVSPHHLMSQHWSLQARTWNGSGSGGGSLGERGWSLAMRFLSHGGWGETGASRPGLASSGNTLWMWIGRLPYLSTKYASPIPHYKVLVVKVHNQRVGRLSM